MTTPIPVPPAPGGVPVPGAATPGLGTEGVNWAELMKQSGGAFEPLPAGDYDVQVTKSEATKSSTGKTMFKMTLNVVAGPHTNRKLWTQLTISPENPNALGIFFAQMKSLGFGPDYFAAQPTPDKVAQDLEGKYARVGVIQKTYQGQLRNEVKGINPAVIMGGQGAVPSAMPAPSPVVAPVPVAVPDPVAPPTPPAPAPTVASPDPAPAPAAPTIDLDAYRAAGWTDEQLIEAGHMEAPEPPSAPAPPAPPVPPAPPAPAAETPAAPPAPAPSPASAAPAPVGPPTMPF